MTEVLMPHTRDTLVWPPDGGCVEAVATERLTERMILQRAHPCYCETRTRKVPTPYVVEYRGKTRRIYCDVIGNNPPCYILVMGVRHTVN